MAATSTVPGTTELTRLSEESLHRLHRTAITEPEQIRSLLERVRDESIVLRNGVDARNDPRTATVAQVSDQELSLLSVNIRSRQYPQLYFNFDLGGVHYFFAAPVKHPAEQDGGLRVRIPAAIYEAERRDLRRLAPMRLDPHWVRVSRDTGGGLLGRVMDCSYQGLGVKVRGLERIEYGAPLRVEFLDGERRGERGFATVRHVRDGEEPGWTRLGLAISSVPSPTRLRAERWERILPRRRLEVASFAIDSLRAIATNKRRSQPEPNVVEFKNSKGQFIRGLLDEYAPHKSGVAVVIPPSWGRTKETFLPLARTIVGTFRAAGQSVSVLRFDGTNRRGESYIDPVYRSAGHEYLGFRFSQAVDDIEAALSFVSETLRPSKTVLITFSLGSIEGRRAVARAAAESLGGWVSVVGMVDLQSGLRAVSGGVDYAYGLMSGVGFGRHELVGVVSDMDATGADALEHRLVFLEDAKRDVARIRAPITWLHGRHDAWMDLQRVEELLSSGDSSDRRLVEIPTGHQLRSSREALDTFRLISTEVARLALGRRLDAPIPDLGDIRVRATSEKARLRREEPNLRGFWRDYLLGRDRQLGIQLMTATSAYRSLMDLQVRELQLKDGDIVVDLGSGTGDFIRSLRSGFVPDGLTVIEVDMIREALERSAAQDHGGLCTRVAAVRIAADLDRSESLPFAEGSIDAALLSLVVGYVSDPAALLTKVRSVLRVGGRMVVSSMRRDADISRIYREGVEELQPDRVADHFGDRVRSEFQRLQREFLNNAARLIQLEEDGQFTFYEPDELRNLISRAGFKVSSSSLSFGDPPQAIVVSATAG